MDSQSKKQKTIDKNHILQYEINSLFDNRIWLNTSEAADYLRISVNALRIKIWRKQIVTRKFGTRLRFKRSELDSHMRLCK